MYVSRLINIFQYQEIRNNNFWVSKPCWCQHWLRFCIL